MQSFTLVDPEGAMAFTQPMGTMGDADGPPTALPPTETAGPTIGTAGPTDGPTDGTSGSPGVDPTGGTDPSPGEVDPSTSPGDSSGGGGGGGIDDPALGGGQSDPQPESGVPAPEPNGGHVRTPEAGDPGTQNEPSP